MITSLIKQMEEEKQNNSAMTRMSVCQGNLQRVVGKFRQSACYVTVCVNHRMEKVIAEWQEM